MTVKICYHCHPNGKPIFDLQAENAITDRHGNVKCLTCVKRDKTGNSELFCRRWGITYDLEDDTVRHKSRLSVPLETEPAMSTTPTIGADSVAIRHEPELKGTFKALRDRGIRITSYRED